MTAPLPLRDLEALEFARTTWRSNGPREEAVRRRFGITLTRYLQWLNRVIDEPAAEVYDPALVRALRQARAAKRARRNQPAGSRA